ncbi:hypothetical protein [Halothermothrix orenii]|uniref:Cellulosome anchoring protein cohesin region n=1 Tax=Halothermothrix orenii (strain H 168 / OCM 544 / DSM 9562) TaxID=373903 RepID=B8CXA9_HALOH|nr:hypothetical protein [Halothermothrix orenii]ACL69928.1 hypothetical protein Hore_11780 [Halothermothrix orenii H 168]
MNNIKKLLRFMIFTILVFTFPCTAAEDNVFVQTDEFNNLRLGNDYIVIVVNKDENAQGRFAIETTGGAPMRNNDDHKPLVYGRPKPWTSYTTIWIDGEHYVFGGKTGRRAGKNGKYGEVTKEPYVKNNSIHTMTVFNKISVEQVLTPVKSSTTGLFNSVQIKYRIKNNDTRPHKIGLRIMLDTMLGENDGAPFRFGQDAVTTDRLYYKKELPVFWQAFDTLSNPNVTSQGTFNGPSVTPPDKVYLADWGSLADGVWNFDFNPNEEFIRKGEFETDSAIAMFWVPEILKPGQEKTYITEYGLGGITIVPGLISLGVTSPAEVTINKINRSFPVIAYVENTAEIAAKNVKIKLSLPDKLTTEQPIRELGNMEPGDISQIVWKVTPTDSNLPREISYEVKVEADNTDSNSVSRNVKFVGPPILNVELKLKDKLVTKLGKLSPNPFTVSATINNTGDSTLFDVNTTLVLPPGLVLAPKERYRKYTGFIPPDQSVEVKWQVKALDVEGKLPFAVEVRGLGGYNSTEIKNIKLPGRKPLIYLNIRDEDRLTEGEIITIDVMGENLENLNKMDMVLKYNPYHLKPIYVSRGNIFLKDGKLLPWEEPNINKEGVIIVKEELPRKVNRGKITSIHFKVISLQQIDLTWGESRFYGNNNNPIKVELRGIE